MASALPTKDEYCRRSLIKGEVHLVKRANNEFVANHERTPINPLEKVLISFSDKSTWFLISHIEGNRKI